MYCTKCGAQIPNGANFCHNCGTDVQDLPAAPNTAAQKPVKKKPGCFARLIKTASILFVALVLCGILFGEDTTKTPTATTAPKATAKPRVTATSKPTATPKSTTTPIPPDVVAMMLTSTYARAGFDVADVQLDGEKVVAYFGINGIAYDAEQTRKTKDQQLLDAWAEMKMSMIKAADHIENTFAAQGKYYPCTVVVVDDRDLSQYTPLLIVEGSVTTYDITTDK